MTISRPSPAAKCVWMSVRKYSTCVCWGPCTVSEKNTSEPEQIGSLLLNRSHHTLGGPWSAGTMDATGPRHRQHRLGENPSRVTFSSSSGPIRVYDMHRSHFQQVTYTRSFTTVLTGDAAQAQIAHYFPFLRKCGIKMSIQSIGETDSKNTICSINIDF